MLLLGSGVAVGGLFLFLFVYAYLFGPADKYATAQQFLVKPGETTSEIASALKESGITHNTLAFRLAYASTATTHGIKPGGYELSGTMDAWTIATTLTRSPYLAWVTFPVGLRKEQVADILADDLSWTPAEKQEWLTIDTATPSSFVEGVYFPDTYLIPSDQTPVQVAERIRGRFQDAFAPYAREAEAKGMSWTDVVTIASLIQREAGSANDMPMISGIIYNRLKIGMPLAIDATLQYMVGSEANGWWPQPNAASTYPDNPFNTYKHAGLPPHPIANPGLVAIEAAINPETTNCLFYLHDSKGQIHCSVTYKGQQQNVAKYLK